MPDITLLGWIHTILGISAISIGIYEIFKNKYFTINSKISQVYFWLTFFTAITALNIYNQGGFGIAHILAILALIALFVGWMTETFDLAGKYTAHLFTLSFSSTFLFHLFPAIACDFTKLRTFTGMFSWAFNIPICSNQKRAILRFILTIPVTESFQNRFKCPAKISKRVFYFWRHKIENFSVYQFILF